MVTVVHPLFTALLALVVLQRLLELALSARNVRGALARGGVMGPGDPYAAIVVLHILVLAAAPSEIILMNRPWRPELALSMAALLVVAQGLRYWAIATLGSRWTTRLVYVPGDRVVTAGPYRFISHPNYVAVVIELAAFPLVQSAWITAGLATLVNFVLLGRRLEVEEELVSRYSALTTAGKTQGGV